MLPNGSMAIVITYFGKYLEFSEYKSKVRNLNTDEIDVSEDELEEDSNKDPKEEPVEDPKKNATSHHSP